MTTKPPIATPLRRPSETGSSLVWVLMALGILSAAVVYTSNLADGRARLLKAAIRHGEHADIRRFVMSSISTAVTAGMVGKTCPTGNIPLYGRNLATGSLAAKIFVKRNATTRFGKWRLRASCAFTGQRQDFEVHALHDLETEWEKINLGLSFDWPDQMWTVHP